MKTVTSVRFFNPGLDYKKHKREIKSEINRVLSAGDLILRGDVEQFEKNLAEFVGTKHAIALNSGTDALYLALKVLGIGPNSRVSVPSHTFVATAQVVAQLGAEPVLYDMDEVGASNVDVHMVAHITGSTEKIPDLDIPIIEDACQALGAVKNPKTAMQCWSFYPAKILGAYGDGGAVTTNDDAYAAELRELRNHYKKDYSKWGINSRMDNLQAVILNVKFKDLNETLEKRKKCAKQYIKAFSDLDFSGKIHLPLKHEQEWRVWQDFVLDCQDKRDALYEFLKTKGVETMKNEYPFPIQKCSNSLAYESRTLRLPCNEHLKKSEIKYVIDCVKEFYAQE
jgi:dTDP-4-amino-4,6-dideoxygalactose transaminase